MALIGLARLYLDGDHLTMLLDHEVEFALLLAVKIKQIVILRKAVSVEFLRHKIFEHSAIVDIGILL